MTSHYIQQLGVAKCREILRGAPEGATDFVFWTGKTRYINSQNSEIFDGIRKEWNAANLMVLNHMLPLEDLRHELSLHDTDDFTHLANHISPLTIVIEEVLQEQFQEANEAGEGR